MTTTRAADAIRVEVLDSDAESALLGALFLAGQSGPEPSTRVLGQVRSTGITREHFYKDRHAEIFTAVCSIIDRGEPAHVLHVAEELRRRETLDQIGGEAKLVELATIATAMSNAAHHAHLVLATARRREEVELGQRLARVGLEVPGGLDAQPELAERLHRLLRRSDAGGHGEDPRLLSAPAFLREHADTVDVIYGRDEQVLAASGESTWLVGPQGIGKTTLAQRLALARAGFQTSVAGFPVERSDRPVLYLAGDRPRQARRSIRRMLTEEQAEALEGHLLFYAGPPPIDPGVDPHGFVSFIRALGVGDVFIDSLKDVALDLVKDEVGSRVNAAFQELLAEGIELFVLHHQRKAASGQNVNRKRFPTSTAPPGSPPAPEASSCSGANPATPSSNSTTSNSPQKRSAPSN